MENVENKVIIITGATSGIGEATARVLAKHGAKAVSYTHLNINTIIFIINSSIFC